MGFTALQLHPALLRGVKDMGFTVPTPIQRDGIPPALAGHDVIGSAMTGSGKTAAFALPILHRLLTNPKRGVTRALVLAPTRELADQITDCFNTLGRHSGLSAASIYGGVGMQPQERALRRGVDVIVACPGRLLDHLQRPYGRLNGVEILVLDEVDRMLDMGFLPDIRRVLAKVPANRQTLLFSATLPAPIAELARQLLKNPVSLSVERPSRPAELIEQSIFPVRQDLKSALLLELLKGNQIASALVFTRTKHRADRVAQYLERNGVACDRVHGNRSQSQRTAALNAFKSGRYRVLVATDVAARGIDIAELSHVVNYDVPAQAEDYVHRVGRTGRAGAAGEAFTFVAPEEQGDLRAIERAVARTLPRKLVDGFDYGAKAQRPAPLDHHLAAVRRAEDQSRAQTSRYAGRGGRSAGHGAAASSSDDSRSSNGPAVRTGQRGQETRAWSFTGSGRPKRGPAPTRARRGPR